MTVTRYSAVTVAVTVTAAVIVTVAVRGECSSTWTDCPREADRDHKRC